MSTEQRSRMMARIRHKDTRPELLLRSYLHSQGFRFRLHDKRLPGKPDLVLKKYNAAIFVHGCFWHRHAGCRYAYQPKSRIEFWSDKFNDNVKRDQNQVSELLASGWRVLIVWECALKKKDLVKSLKQVTEWIQAGSSYSEVSGNTMQNCLSGGRLRDD